MTFCVHPVCRQPLSTEEDWPLCGSLLISSLTESRIPWEMGPWALWLWRYHSWPESWTSGEGELSSLRHSLFPFLAMGMTWPGFQPCHLDFPSVVCPELWARTNSFYLSAFCPSILSQPKGKKLRQCPTNRILQKWQNMASQQGDRWNATVFHFLSSGSQTLGKPAVILYSSSLVHVVRNSYKVTSDYRCHRVLYLTPWCSQVTPPWMSALSPCFLRPPMNVDRNHTARHSNRTQTTTLLLCLLFREDRIATADTRGFRAHRSRGSLLRTAPSSGCLPLPPKKPFKCFDVNSSA